MHQVRTRQGLVSPTTWVLFWFLICSLCGRFGAAFLGFAFNLEDEAFHHAAIVRPDWANATILRDDSIQKALEVALHLDSQVAPGGSQILSTDHTTVGAIFGMAQLTKGLPWVIPRWQQHKPYLNNTMATSYAMKVSHFSHDNLTMEELSDNTVSFTYQFQDFQESTPVPAKKQALINVHCQALPPVPDFRSSNFSVNVFEGSLQWMMPFGNEISGILLVGKSEVYDDLPALVKEHSYIGNSSIAFNCSIYLDSDIIAQGIQEALLLSLVLPLRSDGSFKYFSRAFFPTLEFSFGISRQDQHASAVWLSAYVGNYIGNCLSFLNDVLRRHPIQGEENGISTNLDVKWRRVAGILGGLAAFQVLVGLAGLRYCHRKFEVVDEVATFSYMYRDFPFSSEEERQQESAARLGKFGFVKEGDGVRWKFVPKDVKAA